MKTDRNAKWVIAAVILLIAVPVGATIYRSAFSFSRRATSWVGATGATSGEGIYDNNGVPVWHTDGGAEYPMIGNASDGGVTGVFLVSTGAGLAGGPIVGSGTISIADGGVLPNMLDPSVVTRSASLTTTRYPYITGANTIGSSPNAFALGSPISTSVSTFEGGSTNGTGAINIRPSSGAGNYGAAISLDDSVSDVGGNVWSINNFNSSTSFDHAFAVMLNTTVKQLILANGHTLINYTAGDNGHALTVGGDIEANGAGAGVYFGDGTHQTTASLGTVTSVSMTVPPIMSVAGSPVTGSGTLAVSLATESANTVWCGPTSGGATAPTFRALVAADLPATAVVAPSSLTSAAIPVATNANTIASSNLALSGTQITTLAVTAVDTAGTATRITAATGGTYSASAAGTGGVFFQNGGAGGIGDATHASGAGGACQNSGGTGGAAQGGAAGVGGDGITIGGVGGAGTASVAAGAGGAARIAGGSGGTNNGGGGANGGAVFVRGGGATGAGANGAVNIGDSSTSAVNLAATGINTIVAGPLIITSQAAPGSPIAGQSWFDSTQKAIISLLSGIKQALVGVNFTSTASATISTATTATLIGTGVGTTTLPPNFCIAGKTNHVHVGGVMTTTATPGNFTFVVLYGATTIATTGTLTPGVSLTTKGFDVDVYITFRTCGASGSVMTEGSVSFTSGTLTRGIADLDNNGTATTVDTTAAKAIDVQLTQSAASQTTVGTTATMEILN